MDADLRLLAGDALYALGLARLAETGDLGGRGGAGRPDLGAPPRRRPRGVPDGRRGPVGIREAPAPARALRNHVGNRASPSDRIPSSPMAELTQEVDKKSRYTADRGMAGAFEGETVTRRGLMEGRRSRPAASRPWPSCCPRSASRSGPMFEDDDARPPGRTSAPRATSTPRPTCRGSSTSTPRSARPARPRSTSASSTPSATSAPGRTGPAVRRDLHPLRPPGLPGPLHPGLAAVRLPVPRRRLRLPGQGRRRPAGAPARPLLHARGGRPRAGRASASR